jgi:hypothetical protein
MFLSRAQMSRALQGSHASSSVPVCGSVLSWTVLLDIVRITADREEESGMSECDGPRPRSKSPR